MMHTPYRPALHRRACRTRGVALLYGLIALTVMLIAAAAVVRSFNTSLFMAGNLAFKRDLTNQAERAMQTVFDTMTTGALAAEVTRRSSLQSANYSAVILAGNEQGLPNALLSDAAFAAIANSANDITVPDQQVRIRWVVDRLCTSTGAATPDACTLVDGNVPEGGSASNLSRAEDPSVAGPGAAPRQVVYRLSVRVDGPRSTQAFLQSTFTL